MPALLLATVPAGGQEEELTPVKPSEFCGVRAGGGVGAGVAGAALFAEDGPPAVPLIVRLLCAEAVVPSDRAKSEAALINKRRVTGILPANGQKHAGWRLLLR